MEIGEFIKAANKKHGSGTIIQMKPTEIHKYGENVISTGSISLDLALGIGGIPRGRIVQVLGQPGTGKSTVALHLISEAQKMGLNTLYIDSEYTLDIFYASEIGVDIEEMFIHQPENGEQAMNIAEEAIRSGAVGLIIVDSVAALVPKRELDGEVGDSHVGLLARLMSQTCRMFTGILKTSNTTIVFINQYRETISTMGFGGPSRKPTGGQALEYYSSVIIDLARIKTLKDGESSTGNRTRATVKKNKLASPYRVGEFDIVYGKGIDKLGDLVDTAEALGIIKKSGSWYKDGDFTIQGRSGYTKELLEDAGRAEDLRERIIRAIQKGDAIRLGHATAESREDE